ncbi:hypothetical protein [Rathayibacter sp. VKM Ac-2630]|uniref:hypothetical protein n=1 Tax=Rathayibacter sp. VKM Ac-2630 TaxID=1938617 RepID=UPI00111597CD|nr:hypothetical protein [Rathayibacter sp. VKM Ac-2630]
MTTPEQFGAAVAESGACGLLVDQAAYGDDAAAWAPFVDAATSATQPVIRSEDDSRRYLFFRVS